MIYKKICEIAEKETALNWLYYHKKIYTPDGSIDPEFMTEVSEKELMEFASGMIAINLNTQ